MTLPLPLPARKRRRPLLTSAELDAIDSELEQLERLDAIATRRTAQAPPAPAPEPEQQTLAVTVTSAKGRMLFALVRSKIASERESALAIVRASLERTHETITSAAELEVSPRWIQYLIAKYPSLCSGIPVKKGGRPPKKRTTTK